MMKHFCKENYLSQVKNAMLFHFNRKDIHITLEDLNLLFQSGEEKQKEEQDICDELGAPKIFVQGLLENVPHDHFAARLFAYTFIGLILCAITIFAIRHYSPILTCFSVISIPIFIWNLLGGSCLYEIRTEPTKHLKKYGIYYVFTFPFIAVEQIIVILLNTDIPMAQPYIFPTYYLSIALSVAAFIFLLTAIYRLYKGFCFPLGLLILCIGTICSSILFINYVYNFEGYSPTHYICSIPYTVSFFFSILYYLYTLKKKGGR